MADVFISYHKSDETSALVRRIADELKSRGISCWYDTKDSSPIWLAHAIQMEIQRCKVFLLIWDVGANNSEWCLAETYAAFQSENHPVRISFKVGHGTFAENEEMWFYMNRCKGFYGGDSPKNADIQALTAQIANISRTRSVPTKSGKLSRGTLPEMNAST